MNEEVYGLSDRKQLEGEDSLLPSLSQSQNDDGYPMYDIKVEKGFYTVYELKRKFDAIEKRIVLDSDFQRESVWKLNQKAELVESILMGLPLPIFYFNQDKKGRLIVIDGRQRLTALFEFMNNKWALKNLKVLTELNGKKFQDLQPVVQSQIEDYQIQAHVIQPPTPDRIKFDIFDRVNRAGTQLNKQEIRNALYQGNSTLLLNEIVKTKTFLDATDNAFANNSRMKDKYIVLRYIAFKLYFEKKLLYIDGEKYVYRNDIDELLGITMEYLNNVDECVLKSLYFLIIETLDKINKILGNNAFRLIRNNGNRSPINMNVFETIMYFMSKVNLYDDDIKEKIINKLNDLKKSEDFIDSIGNHRDNWVKVEKRFKMMDDLLEEIYA